MIKSILKFAVVVLCLFWPCHAGLAKTVSTTKAKILNAKKCMADAIYYEAKSEPKIGKAAIGRVILNRIKFGFAPTVCGVVYQGYGTGHSQFQFLDKPSRKINQKQYEICLEVAEEVLYYNAYPNLVPNAVFFHNNLVNPNWKKYCFVDHIGHHYFYKLRKHV